ncbi:MAG: hypothetical protein A4E58_00214 [Syntrophorhabdus sp. PtaB.Bin006]|nr:MAG: hypothetical protein A4E58_00214 [Syntrophorhabdus sp. PtaB.Bin006]
MSTKRILFFAGLVFFGLCVCTKALAIDSELTRRTLRGLAGVHVMVEDLQPGFKEYAEKSGLSASQMERNVVSRIERSGIRVLRREIWLKTPGRPLLYININTHDNKFRFAYDAKVELRQIVAMEANPQVKTLAGTWSINMTGIAEIDELNVVGKNVAILVDRFISAYESANR